jgi:hypothetical protein
VLHGRQLLAERLDLHLGVDVLAAEAGHFSPETGDYFGLSYCGFLKVNGYLLECFAVLYLLQLWHTQLSQSFRDPSSI